MTGMNLKGQLSELDSPLARQHNEFAFFKSGLHGTATSLLPLLVLFLWPYMLTLNTIAPTGGQISQTTTKGTPLPPLRVALLHST